MEKLEALCNQMGWSKAEAVDRLINYWIGISNPDRKLEAKGAAS
jgi:hypothetical protein